jgi:hypothetical protein
MSLSIPRYTPPVDEQGFMAREWQAFFLGLAASAELTRGIEVVIAGEGMPIQAKQIVPPIQVGNTPMQYYSVDARGRATITQATATNATGTDQTLTVYLVPAGSVPNSSTAIVYERNIPAGETVVMDDLRHAVDPGGSIWATSSAANQIVLMISGALFFS